jgi:hypothetical protein
MDDELKELTKMGIMIDADAKDDINDKTVERTRELHEKGNTPMFMTEDLAEELNSNQGFAEALNNSRNERSRSIDNNKQADKVLEEPFTEEKLDTWRNNKYELDMNEVDTKNDILL